MQAVESYQGKEDVEKLQDVIRQLELQNAKLRKKFGNDTGMPSKNTPLKEKHNG